MPPLSAELLPKSDRRSGTGSHFVCPRPAFVPHAAFRLRRWKVHELSILREALMAEYIAKLHNQQGGAEIPTVKVDTITEFEAAALALEQFRQRGVPFDGQTGIELLEGTVTASKPVPVRDILYWLRNKPEGLALVKRDGLGGLLDYVKD
jgi:hypothetical protein